MSSADHANVLIHCFIMIFFNEVNRRTNFYNILYEYAIEGYLNLVLFIILFNR